MCFLVALVDCLLGLVVHTGTLRLINMLFAWVVVWLHDGGHVVWDYGCLVGEWMGLVLGLAWEMLIVCCMVGQVDAGLGMRCGC